MAAPLLLVLALAAAPPPDTLTDAAIAAFAAKAFDPAHKAFAHDVLGVHHGTPVVADYPCGDVCPSYTVQVIHYAVEPGPACARIGGVVQRRMIPRGIASMPQAFCVPSVLGEGQ